jgi:hypothetical protein
MRMDDVKEKNRNWDAKEINELDEALYRKHPYIHSDWAEKFLDFKIGIEPPNDWIEDHFEPANNETGSNFNLLWDMVTNMFVWADENNPDHDWMVEMFEEGIASSIAFNSNTATLTDLRKTILECKEEILEKTEKMANDYLEEARQVMEWDPEAMSQSLTDAVLLINTWIYPDATSAHDEEKYLNKEYLLSTKRKLQILQGNLHRLKFETN